MTQQGVEMLRAENRAEDNVGSMTLIRKLLLKGNNRPVPGEAIKKQLNSSFNITIIGLVKHVSLAEMLH